MHRFVLEGSCTCRTYRPEWRLEHEEADWEVEFSLLYDSCVLELSRVQASYSSDSKGKDHLVSLHRRRFYGMLLTSWLWRRRRFSLVPSYR